MDTAFSDYMFENSNATQSQIYNKLTDSTNKRFKFKPINQIESIKQTQNQDLLKLNLNNKKDFQKKLLNFDINRNFEDIYWLSLKEKPKFNNFYEKNLAKPSKQAVNTTVNQDSSLKLDYLITSNPQQSNTIQQLSSPTSQTNKTTGSGNSSKKKKKTKLNDTPSTTNTAAVLVDLNRQSINLPLTPIKDDLFKNRYFENYLLNRKLNTSTTTNNNQYGYSVNAFNSVSCNQLSTIYFKPNFNMIDQSVDIINDALTSKHRPLQNHKLDAIEGSKITIRPEELTPRKLLNCGFVSSNSSPVSKDSNTPTAASPNSGSTYVTPNNTNNTSSPNSNANTINNNNNSTNTNTSIANNVATNSNSILQSKLLYKIRENENLNDLKLTKEEPIQTQFRLKPLNSKPSNHNLIEEINESDFDSFDKKLNKNYLKSKEKSTKPIKMINHKLPNSNSEEVTQNINANSEFFTAKATTIVSSTPPAPSASSSTSIINSKTKLAKLVKTDEEGFQNRKSKNYVYTNNKKQDENSSEEEEANSKQQKSKKGYNNNEDFLCYTRVESPHKLGKSMPDGYIFVGSSSIQVNSNANNLLNQQFQLFQSQIFDKP